MAAQLSEAIVKIKDTIKGRVLTPDDRNYDEARQVWNAMINRRPAVIVQPADAGDVGPAIQFARANALEIPFAARATISPGTRCVRAA
jgi:hypothetical protein